MNNIPPDIKEAIISAPMNLKNPDLLVNIVVTEENIININVKK